MNKEEAYEIYKELKFTSEGILSGLGMDVEPIYPVDRTRPFNNVCDDESSKIFKRSALGGKRRCPGGVVFHYTGGLVGLKSLRWGNDPKWGNSVSSWHALILDNIPNDALGEAWKRKASNGIKNMFPAPVIICCDWFVGAWHAGFVNNITLGFENRNAGIGAASVTNSLRKAKAGSLEYETYTSAQIISNIALLGLANVLFELKPWLVFGHQCVDGEKSDPGPLFPIHGITDAVFKGVPLDLSSFSDQSHHSVASNDIWYDPDKSFRGDDFHEWGYYFSIRDSALLAPTVDDSKFISKLSKLGFNTGAAISDDGRIVEPIYSTLVSFFQRGLYSWSKSKIHRNYARPKADGKLNELTAKCLDIRLSQLGIGGI